MQVLHERKGDSAVLFGLFALVALAVAVRVATGSMGTVGKAVVLVIAALVAAGCVWGLVHTKRRGEGRIVVDGSALVHVFSNGATERIERQPVAVVRRVQPTASGANTTWLIEPEDRRVVLTRTDGTSAEIASILLHGYRPPDVVAACEAEGWHVTSD